MEAFSREHLIWECEQLQTVRHANLGKFVDLDRQDLAWLIWVGSTPFWTFFCGLYGERSLFDDMGVD